MYPRILCPVDGSASSDRGMREAIALAGDQHAQLRFVHVVDLSPPIFNYGGLPIVPDLSDIFCRAGEQIVERAVGAAREQGVRAEGDLPRTRGGRIAELLLKAAMDWQASIIVMGTHGRRGVSHLLLGSDAEAVLKQASVPVLLVRLSGEASA